MVTFKLGLAAIRSLYPLDRLPPALHGVNRFANCISAWHYGQAHAFYPFWPAHRPHCAARQHASWPSTIAIAMFNICRTTIAFRLTCDPQLPCVHSDCIIALQLGLAAKRSLYRLVLRLSFLSTLRPAYRPRCAVRQHASIIAIAPFSLWLAASRLLSSYAFTLLSAIAVCPQRLPIAFKLGLATKRSL